MKVCPDCNRIVSAVDAVLIGGKYYHRSCRTCCRCGKLISGRRVLFQDKPCHPECASKPVTCSICGNSIRRYREDRWGNIACPEHAHRCHYCGRFLSPATRGGGYLSLPSAGSSRKIRVCGLCQDSLVTTPQQVEECRSEVMSLFRKNGILGIPSDIPILLSELREANQKAGKGFVLGNNRGRISASRSRYSFEIRIYHQLPRLVFCGVLAHELLHSWLALYAIHLPDEEEEGFCNLGEYLYLSQDPTPYGAYRIYLMEKSSHPVYGDGFRLMEDRLSKLGWKGLMDALLWQGRKPVEK